jgi:TonB-dependent SusC/RagA subfamily outer membrane receptor
MKALFLITLAFLSYSLKAQNTDVAKDTTQAPKGLTTLPEGTIVKDPKSDFDAPLYILDGKEISRKEVAKIKSEHIASVTVLKDAESVSPYGEKGKNGVVLIETKKSKLKLE